MNKKILIIQTAFIGDVILASSMIEAVRSEFPGAEIHFLLRKGNEVLLGKNPHLKKIWIWDKNKKKYLNLFKTIFSLRKVHFDYVFNIQRFFSTGLVTAFIKAKIKVGFNKNPLSFMFDFKVKHEIPGTIDGKILHEVDRNLKLIKAVKKDVQNYKPKLYTDYIEIPETKKPYLVMAPTSVWFTKGWPLKKWCELTYKLQDYTIYLIGAPQDEKALELVKSDQEHVINMAGKLSLIQSVKLMENAHRVIANDSAALHMASSVNAPSTAIFCSTVPEFGYGPLSDDSIIIQASTSLECKPCGLHGKKACPLEHFKCAYDIEVDRVINTIVN